MSALQISLRYELVDGSVTRSGTVLRTPFVIGRLPECDLVLVQSYVSRRHAEILLESDGFYLVDLKSRHGTCVNGESVADRRRIESGDAITFGSLEGPVLRVETSETESNSSLRDLIEQMPSGDSSSSGLEKLRWFFESARKLTAEGAVDQILAALLDITLDLTRVERGYVYLINPSGKLELALGRDNTGDSVDDATLSHGAIAQAMSTSSDYIITDTLSAGAQTDSIVAHNIRSVICIPLRKRRPGSEQTHHDILGLLYLDSRMKAGRLNEVDSGLLKAISTNAAALIDNAQLTLAEENERRYREELSIAAAIQQNLMALKLPSLSYATLAARSIACLQVGGDFYDIISDEGTVSIVVADVSGKGISAAILASNLQGLIYSQLIAGQALSHIASIVNRYICSKGIGKYATMTILRMTSDGKLSYINCGHVHPFLRTGSGYSRLSETNLPVGLMGDAVFQSAEIELDRGARILVVTDGVTEAENAAGEFYGEDRLGALLEADASFNEIYEAVHYFCGPVPLNDDCTMLEIAYMGSM